MANNSNNNNQGGKGTPNNAPQEVYKESKDLPPASYSPPPKPPAQPEKK